MAPKQLVWLITGTSSGFGRDLTLAALKRGDKVIATARNVNKIAELKAAGAEALQLDVTDSLDNLKAIAAKAVAIYGRVDVLVNNAAYAVVGSLEENTPQETLDQYNTNVFGVLNVTRAFLPNMRERRSGTIIIIGSSAGWTSAAGAGLYCSTKYAIRGIAETFHDELNPLGLKVHCIEPGYFRTSLLSDANRTHYIPRIPDYAPAIKALDEMYTAYNGKQPGDPRKLAEIIVDLVRGEGVVAGKEGKVPVVLPLGSDVEPVIRGTCEKVIGVLDEWKDIIVSTDFSE